MQKKSNRKKPDSIILFEIGIIVALLFVNYGLNISYHSKPVVCKLPIENPSGEWVTSIEYPLVEPIVHEEPPKQKIEKASIFDPMAQIELVSKIFEVKTTIMAPSFLPKVGKIAPIVVKPRIDSSTKIGIWAEVMPQFPGGDKVLRKYIVENFEVPQGVYNYADQIEVVVEFVIGANGQVSKVEVLKCTVPGLGAEQEARKLYKNMPKWKPGTNNGKAVNVRLRQPIKIYIN